MNNRDIENIWCPCVDRWCVVWLRTVTRKSDYNTDTNVSLLKIDAVRFVFVKFSFRFVYRVYSNVSKEEISIEIVEHIFHIEIFPKLKTKNGKRKFSKRICQTNEPSADNWQCSINLTPQENNEPQWGHAMVFSCVWRRICSRIRYGLSGRCVQPKNEIGFHSIDLNSTSIVSPVQRQTSEPACWFTCS